MSWDIELDDQLLQDLYAWIDQIPLSRPKKRIEKDFADGVMVAELIKYYFPSWVDLHNYAAANSTQQKLINWGLLNRKIFYRFGLNVPEQIMRGICLGRPKKRIEKDFADGGKLLFFLIFIYFYFVSS
ncbi:unnamed protein product [Rotaria sp. Silwood2]|nr:unnamed protein product [Rotaria sp. Silwood2]